MRTLADRSVSDTVEVWTYLSVKGVGLMALPSIPLQQLKELSATNFLTLSSPVAIHERTPDRKLAVIVPFPEWIKMQKELECYARTLQSLNPTVSK